MSLGGGHSCATIVDNGMRCWGDNQRGQLGDAKNVNSPIPVAPTAWGSGPSGVGGGKTILGFAAGDSHTCAISSDGRLFCWGGNNFGQLGNDSTRESNVAQPVRPIPNPGTPLQANAVVAGDNHTCALYAPGNVACWGRGYEAKPQFIRGLSNPQRIAAGGNQACALEAGGVVKCWKAATPNPQSTSIPQPIAGILAKDITVGRSHACAIIESGAFQCWGLNGQGQLGSGSRIPSASPVTVVRAGAFDAAVSISAGSYHTCAALASGAVECWGDNGVGKTGDPAGGITLTAHRVITSGAKEVSAGSNHSCARILVGQVGQMSCWGSNGTGQLGNSSVGQFSLKPVQVAGLP